MEMWDLDWLLYGGLPPGPLDSDNNNENNNNNNFYNWRVSCENCIHSEPDDFGRLFCSIYEEYVSSQDAYGCEYFE